MFVVLNTGPQTNESKSKHWRHIHLLQILGHLTIYTIWRSLAVSRSTWRTLSSFLINNYLSNYYTSLEMRTTRVILGLLTTAAGRPRLIEQEVHDTHPGSYKVSPVQRTEAHSKCLVLNQTNVIARNISTHSQVIRTLVYFARFSWNMAPSAGATFSHA